MFFLKKSKKKSDVSQEILSNGLEKSKKSFIGQLKSIFKSGKKLDEDILLDIEDILVQADIGVELTINIIERLQAKYKEDSSQDVYIIIEDILKELLIHNVEEKEDSIFPDTENKPNVILIVGVNGVGKTTTISKLTKKLLDKNKKVQLAACDTFRAAGIEQITEWAKKLGVPVISHQSGADPAAVAFDAVKSGISKEMDYVIIDTAGRLHTKHNLMRELSKVQKVIARAKEDAPEGIWIVLDATTGQNGLFQAKKFNEHLDLNGIILTKMDGTAKGGIVFSVVNELKIPIKFIGLGEQPEDLIPFDSSQFIKALFK